MKKFFLATLLALAASPTLAADNAAYHSDPASGGRHYDCSVPGTVIEYENSDVIWECGGLELVLEKRFPRETIAHWKIVDPSKMYVKSAPSQVCVGGTCVDVLGPGMPQELVNEITLAQLTEPFYSSGEKRKVRALGAGLALDLIGTAVGLGGACSEAGLIAGKLPGLSLVINGGYFLHTRSAAKRTPRFFDTDKTAYFPAATHAAAGISNLLKCGM